MNSGENSETRSVEVYIQHCSPTMKGDSCFRICQIRWIKTKKVTFSQLKTSLSRNFVYNLETFRKCIFTILLQIQHENHFLPTSKHRQAKVCRFRGIEKKMYWNETPSWHRSQNREQPRIFRVTGAKQNARKLLFTDLVNTNFVYLTVNEDNCREQAKQQQKWKKKQNETEVSLSCSFKRHFWFRDK